MNKVAFDRKRRVLWASFPGTFTPEDLAALDALADMVVGIVKPIDGVFDFSESAGTGLVFRDDFIERGQQVNPMSAMRRIVVASSPGILNLAQVFAAAQALTGAGAPVIVNTAEDARRRLGHATLELQPIEIGALRALFQAERGT